jgi:hypothetical protein
MAKRPEPAPTVLTRAELNALQKRLSGIGRCIAADWKKIAFQTLGRRRRRSCSSLWDGPGVGCSLEEFAEDVPGRLVRKTLLSLGV